MDLRKKWALQEHYRRELSAQYGPRARRELMSLENWMDEKLRWLARVDEAVDELANHFGVEIPYATAEDLSDETRFNPAYRMELLKEKLIEREGQT